MAILIILAPVPALAATGATGATDPEAIEQHTAAERMRQGAETAPSFRIQTTPVWPAGGSDLITSYYGYRVHPIYGDIRFHYGLDIGVDQGTPVVAPLAGTVYQTYWNDAVGNVVEINHGSGVMTRYCHLSVFLAAPGQSLAQGQVFALSGGTGYLSTGPHLHFEAYDYVNSNDAPVPPYFTYTRGFTMDPQVWLAYGPPPSPPATPALPPDISRSLVIKDCLGGGMMRLLLATAADPAFAPNEAWRSGLGDFNGASAKMATGDFNSDGFTDVAMLYDYGRANSGLFVFTWDTDHYDPQQVWRSGDGCWDAAKSKIVSGDFAGDAKTDIAIIYDYGNATTAIWTFATNVIGNSISVNLNRAWISLPGCFDARCAQPVGGDFVGDDKADVAILYDYGGATSWLWTFMTSGSIMTSSPVWKSGAGCWDTARSKIVSGQYSGDAKADLAVLYEYGERTSAIWTFVSSAGALTPSLVWTSGVGVWDASRSKIAAGNFGGDANTDLVLLYDYGNSTAVIWTFTTDGLKMTPNPVWGSAAGAFDASRMVLDGS